MKILIIARCERCKKKVFLEESQINKTIKHLIMRGSELSLVSIYGTWIFLCQRCQEDHTAHLKERRNRDKAFIENMDYSSYINSLNESMQKEGEEGEEGEEEDE